MPRKPILSLRDVYGRRGSQSIKSRIQNQAATQARREFKPQIRAARGGIRSARRSYRQEKQANAGVSTMLQNALSSQIADLGDSGLKGRYLQQTKAELVSSKADAAGYAAFANPDARATFQEARASAQQEVAGLRADEATSAANTAESLTSKALTQAQAAAKAKQSKAADSRQTSQDRSKEFQAALHEATRLIEASGDQSPDTWTPDVWAAFEKEIRSAEGVGFSAARKAVTLASRYPGLLGVGAAGTSGKMPSASQQKALYAELNQQARAAGHSPVSQDFFERWLRARLGSGG